MQVAWISRAAQLSGGLGRVALPGERGLRRTELSRRVGAERERREARRRVAGGGVEVERGGRPVEVERLAAAERRERRVDAGRADVDGLAADDVRDGAREARAVDGRVAQRGSEV